LPLWLLRVLLLLLLLRRLLGPLLLRLLSGLSLALLRLPLWLLRVLLLLLLLRRLLCPLLLRWLSRLSARLLWRLPLLLLLACLRLWWLPLGPLLLRGWRRTFLLLPALPGFGLAVFFLLPVLLRVRTVKRTEKQKQGGGTGCSNKLHGNDLRYVR